MQVAKDCVVSIVYTIGDDTSTTLESNRDAMPMAFLCGHDNMLPALEAALLGKSVGDRINVTLSPEQAYGERRDNATRKVPVKHIASRHKRLVPGTFVKVNSEQGYVDAAVVKAGKFMVELDFNHPFAGKTLHFDVEIKAIRAATDDEIAHGHAHGDGGHHH